jgi:hypothetical protein
MPHAAPAFKCGHLRDRLVKNGGNIYETASKQRCYECFKLSSQKKKMRDEEEKRQKLEQLLLGLQKTTIEEQPKDWLGHFTAAVRILKATDYTATETAGCKRRVVDSCMRGWQKPHKNADRDKWQRKLDWIANTWGDAVALVYGESITPEAIPDETRSGVEGASASPSRHSSSGTDLVRILELVDEQIANPFRVVKIRKADGTLPTDDEHRRWVLQKCRDRVRRHWENLTEKEREKYSNFKPKS